MMVGERAAIGFDRATIGVGVHWGFGTLWINFLGFYLNLYLGRQIK